MSEMFNAEYKERQTYTCQKQLVKRIRGAEIATDISDYREDTQLPFSDDVIAVWGERAFL